VAEYRSRSLVPKAVESALQQAAQFGFAQSSTPEVGRLLMVLAAQVRSGRVGEIGAGAGVGAAWIVSGLAPDVPFYTVERDEALADGCRQLLRPFSNAHVLHGDWKEILPYGPFKLLFADTKAKEDEPELMLTAVEVGGLVVLDDLTPEEFWPPEWHGRIDRQRMFWLNDDRVLSTEIRVTTKSAVILATRIR